ncbi:hypothetical protein [Pseudomonas sp. 6D_7.1_Bac1]|uniref:hypothetical protein n=1 Tax=Pseudomonas sp. 6D_7.1_Bac1 TaxID=2971615 RepID=UPI0021C79EC4|nr:hypothetical protein [Pseudomonas sp. 6D_7.1_Bac1]MCU1751840.1 hypothetical protein [Pseudomonas sp. 6D_7.1_Bac1]
MFVSIESRTSRTLLKSICYGLPFDATGLHSDTKAVTDRLDELRHRYTSLRISSGNSASPVSNYLFYLMLKEKYSGFHFELRKPERRVVTNLHLFKVKGRIPSLAALLLSDSLAIKTDIENKYERVRNLNKYTNEIASLISGSGVMPPTERSMQGLVNTLELCKKENTELVFISAICPDYSYTRDADGKPQYTFHSVGDNTGLAGDKLIKAASAIKTFGADVGVQVSHGLFGGEFEYVSFYKSDYSPSQRAEFLNKVDTQLHTIGGKLEAPFSVESFFELCGGEEGWNDQHQQIKQRIKSGDMGLTGLDKYAFLEVYESRKALYAKWFPSSEEEIVWNNFISQAAEYALMGKLFNEHYKHHVVLAVDHYKMEPFYSYFGSSSVLYVKTDYL